MNDYIMGAREKGYVRGRLGEDPSSVDHDNDPQVVAIHPAERCQFWYGMRDGYNTFYIEILSKGGQGLNPLLGDKQKKQ